MNTSKSFLQRMLISIFLAVLGVAALVSPGNAWTADPYTWGKVAIGGGGEIPALVIHPKVQDVMYIGADVGGLDRWDPVGQQWIPTLDFMRTTDNNANNFGVTGIAVDPNDATGNIVYAAVGIYDWWNGEVLKSTDRGNTWIRNSMGMFPFNSNGDQSRTQRLVVDPANSNVLYVAARDGLYRSTDAATTWTKLASAPVGDTTKLHSGGGQSGDEMVAIDQTSGTVTGPTRSKRVFLAPLGSALYKTEDGGTTWSAMSGAPVSVGHAAINSAGVMYVTNDSGVYKYTGGASGTWSTINPAGAGPYMTIAIDPFNNNNIITVKDTNGGTNSIYRSTDGGATWPYTGSDTVTTVPAWIGGMGIYMYMLAFDPFRQGTVWSTDDASPFMTSNIMASTVAWSGITKGHEETVEMPAMLSPPSGPTQLYYGVADFGAFSNTSVTSWPNRIVIAATPGGANGSWPWLDMTGCDFEEANPNFVAFVGCEGWSGPRGGGAYTSDGGVTYHQFATYPANFGGRVAVSASSQAMVWAASSENPASRYTPSYSSDTGATWHTCSGAPGLSFGYNIFNYNSPLCSDRKNGAKFYIYNDDGTFYRSTDTGHTFTQVASGLGGDGRCNLIANPYVEGDLWLSLHTSGLYHSTDSGSTWTHLANVQNAYMVTVGKGPSANVASIYTMGMVDGDTNEGVFRSDNLGASWFKVDITRPYPGDSPDFMVGDRQNYGTVYIGTGVGIYYGQRGSSAPPAPTGLTANAGNAQVALSWSASSGATSYNVKRSTVNGSGYVTISSPASTSYTNTGLTNGTTYYYVVTAVNSTGESGNSNQASATPSAPIQAQIIAGTATIDGTAEAAWNAATAYTLTKTTGTITNGADCSATWKGMWDATNLYILTSVTDDVKTNDSVGVWDDDSVEIYLDADHNGGTAYDANDRQIGCGWGDTTPVEGGGRAITGVTFAKTDPTGTTYIIETKIPWAVEAFTPAANAVIGIDVMVNDDDDGGLRDGKVIWNDGTDQAWTNPSLFGTGKLNGSTIPPAPTGLTATPGNAQVALSWTASSGATSYSVKRSTVSGSGYVTVSSPATASYTNTGLTNGTTYYFVVTALNAGGESGNSNQASATPAVIQAQIPYGTPVIDGIADAVWSGATAYTLGKSTGTISGASDCSATWKGLWDGGNLYILTSVTDDVKVNDSTSPWDDDTVEIYLDADHNGGTVYDANDRQLGCGWGDAAPVEGAGRAIAGAAFGKTDPTGTTYLIEAKIPWAIEAFTPAGNAVIGIDVHVDDDDDGGTRDGKLEWTDGTDQAWTNPSLFGTGKLLPGSAPAAPTGLTATPGNTQVALSWTASSGATTYNVKRSTVSGSGYVTVSSPATTSYTNTGLTNGTAYYFVVTAVNINGESANSTQASATPQAPAPPAPTGLAAVPTDTQVALTWNASTGATSYNVYRGTTAGGESGTAIATGIATTSYTNTGLTDGTNYFYTVKAVNASGTSGASNETSGIPAQFNFESGLQTWAFVNDPGGPGTGVAQSTTQAFGRTHSLAETLNGGAGNTYVYINMPGVPSTGKTITAHVYLPAGMALTGAGLYIQDNVWAWTGNFIPVASLTLGGWNTVTYTVPATAAMPLQRLGIQFTTSGTWAGTVYVDTVGW